MNGYHRAAWIMKYLDSDLSSDALREIAAREAIPDIPAFQSAMFDSSGQLLLRTAKQLAIMLDSPSPLRDNMEYIFNYAVRFRLEPLRSLDDYIRSRRAPGVARAERTPPASFKAKTRLLAPRARPPRSADRRPPDSRS